MTDSASAPADVGFDDDSRRQAGKLLFQGGALAIPIGVGAALGYWASDAGVRWLPTMLAALTSLGIVALAAMIGGSYLLGPARGKLRGRKRIVAFTVGIVALCAVKVAISWADRASPLTAMGEPGLLQAFQLDARQYGDLERSLGQVVRRVGEVEALTAEGATRVLTADEEATLADAWGTYVHAAFALDRIRAFYEDYFRFDLARAERDLHLRSFLLTFAAELAVYEHTASLLERVRRNANVVKFLDVERPSHGLPAGTWTRIAEDLAGLTDLSRVVAGKRYLAWLDAVHGARAQADSNGYGWLWRDVERKLAAIDRRSNGELVKLTAVADAAPLGARLKALAFPVQASVAEWMGDTRVQRKGRYLIPPELLAALRADLQPGDVMLGRKNWYLSNVGLPGFWPHAMLYVGTDQDLSRAFDEDPEVLAWVQAEAGAPLRFTELLRQRYPDAFALRAAADPADPLLVIEAVSEGVLQSTLAHASGDYLAALRPRLTPRVKAQAVARAFAYLGRPYDFDFDFATDHALVCSELVWRSYRPARGEAGLVLPTVTVAGRQTLPANEIARCFVAERGGAAPQFEFVAFVDASEAEQRAFRADEQAFVDSAGRSKWDLVQK